MAEGIQTQQADALNKIVGNKGCHIETGTSEVSGQFWAIQTITACSFTTLTMPDNTGDSILTLPANFLLPTRVTAFQLTSGSLIAYKD